ncbi:MAG TPA: tetratricopeptide repeat protein [Chthonomonadaceae bacterium]|nr:tetratricopeptide repeat protein [Chthonomonadaceae bacterium]
MSAHPSTAMESVTSTPRRPFGRRLLGSLLLVCVVAAVALNLRFLRDRPVQAHILQGVAMQQAGKLTEAEQEWRTALRLAPSRREPYQLLSALYMKTDRPEAALPLLERLRQLAPNADHTLCNLAEAYTRTGQGEKALETARQAVVIEPQCPRAHALLGILLGDRQEKSGAVTELTRAAALAPDDEKIVTSLAQAQLTAGDLDGAERTARAVVARWPRYPTAWYVLGSVFAARPATPENLREGIAAFTQVAELKPDWEEARTELQRLRARQRALPSSNAGPRARPDPGGVTR